MTPAECWWGSDEVSPELDGRLRVPGVGRVSSRWISELAIDVVSKIKAVVDDVEVLLRVDGQAATVNYRIDSALGEWT